MLRATFVIPLLLASTIGACKGEGDFTCAEDEACAGVGPGAQCEANGWCSFEDVACDSGRRYGELAGDGLGGICVGEEGSTEGSSTSDPPSTTTADPTLEGPLDTSAGPGLDTSEDTGPPVVEDWWSCSWAERREIVLEVPDTGEVLTNVPVLVILDDSRIDPTIMAEDGRDLRFVTDDGTMLSHELEQWSPEGLSWAWVRVPELPPGQTRVTMYYGNPGAEGIPGAEAWSGYTGVWHMGFEFTDATAINAPGLGQAVQTDGHAGPALRFAPPTDGMEIMPSPPVAGLFAQGGTITAMIRPSGWGGGGQGLIVSRADSSNGDGGWLLAIDGARQALRFARGFTQNRRTWYTPDGSITLHAWHHVAVVYQDDPLADAVLYIDGAPQATRVQGMTNGTPEADTAPAVHVGGVPFEPEITFEGIVDEARIAPISRSPAWMTVELAVMRDELASFGPPQGSPCE